MPVPMTMPEAGLRGGAIALFLLLAMMSCREARRDAASRYGALFAVCGIAYLIESAPPFAAAPCPAWLVPVRLLSIAAPAVFQLWVAARFDDSFRPAWWRWLPFAGMWALAGWAMFVDRAVAWHAVQIAALALVGVAIWQALGGRAGDLVESRRRFRVVLALGAGLAIAGLTALAVAGGAQLGAGGSIAGPATVLPLALAACWLALSPRGGSEIGAGTAAATAGAPGQAPPVLPAAIDPEERGLLERLQRVMEAERAYREEGFGIARLAERLGIPEYRLRRLINQRLGHRNFTSFVNGYRLAETIGALSDPSQAAVPILTIALDAGFQSIGPFNRIFKAETGMTPTEFRRDRLGREERRAAE
jgi:AraC-like DNA-binding protein